MPLASYILPLAAAGCLMAVAHSLGSWGCCWLYVVPLCVLAHVAVVDVWHRRERERLASVAQEHMAAGKQLVDLWPDDLADLPAWVRFPDTERVEWLNKVVRQLWPYAGEYARHYIKSELQPLIAASLPGPLKAFRFDKIDMGKQPCRVGGVKVYKDNVGRDQVLLDMDVAYAGDCDISIALDLATASGRGVTLKGGVTDVLLTGRIRAMLAPLIPTPPMVAAVRVYFLERPSLDFRLTGLGELADFPLLTQTVRSVVHQQMAAICVIPNAICVPLVPGATDLANLILPQPDGVLRLQIVEARQLENKDIGFIRKGRSDPYAVVSLGTQTYKTKVIQNNLHPVWNENFELSVDAASDQQLRIELFDEDAGKDEELGRLMLDMSYIRQRCLAQTASSMQSANLQLTPEQPVPPATADEWFELEACQTGELRLQMQWLVLTTDVKVLKEPPSRDGTWMRGNRTMHDAALLVYVDNVADLPYPKANLAPSPLLELSLGSETRRTLPKWSTSNPAWQEKFVFFVSQPDTQQLQIRALDSNTKRSLGTCLLSLRSLLSQPGLEMRQQTFPLALGTHTAPLVPVPSPVKAWDCPLVMTVRLRPLTGMKKSDLMHALVGANGRPVPGADQIESMVQGSSTSNAKPPLPSGRPSSPMSLILDVPNANNNNNRLAGSGGRHSDTASVGGRSLMKRRGFLGRLRSSSKRRTASVSSLFRSGHCGHVQVALQYHSESHQLVVVLHRAENLTSVSATGGADPYCQLKLLPTSHSAAKHKHRSNIIASDMNPVWDESFMFALAPSALRTAAVRITVKDGGNFGAFSKPPVLGVMQLNLVDYDLAKSPLAAKWFDLQPPSLLE